MKINTMVNYVFSGQAYLMWRLNRTFKDFYRTCFLTSAFAENMLGYLNRAPISCEALQKQIGLKNGQAGLESWLNLGVQVGELKKSAKGYEVKGFLSRWLSKPANDPYQALVQEIGTLHYDYITQALPALKHNRKIPFSESYGELVARSSLTIAPLVNDVVDTLIPCRGQFRLLEVGCGAGAYIRRACECNPEVTAVGLELQPQVARMTEDNMQSWNLTDRVRIETADVQDFETDQPFDLITLYNNIYYFPVADRVALFKKLQPLLASAGRVALLTGCQGGGALMECLNLWASMTAGSGALPDPKELCQQFTDAGFSSVTRTKVVPLESFWLFQAVQAA